MFSKSKRFPDAERDYIPGPGEYEVTIDETSPYKRHGFISQTSRFGESTEHLFASSNSLSDFINSSTSTSIPRNSHNYHKNDSSTTCLSVSSTTSSIRTLVDDNMSRSPTSAKKLSSPTSPETPIVSSTAINHFEKYKNAMQKEMDALQARTKKLESTIQSLEANKAESRSIILAKDLELADLRSKNNILQKTINRQEVSSKVTQLQKKIEQLEQLLQTTQLEHNNQINEKENTIASLNLQVESNTSIINDLNMQQIEHQNKQVSLEAHIHDLAAKLSASEFDAKEKEMQINELKNEIQCMSQSIDSFKEQVESYKNEIGSIKLEKQELKQTIENNNQEITQLNARLQLKDEEIDLLLNKVDEKDCELQNQVKLVSQLQDQFKQYREYMENTVVPHLRKKRTEADEYHIKEFNRILTEFYEAKKFINKQAQQMDGLKSDVHWLTSQNEQMNNIVKCMSKEYKDQASFTKKMLRVLQQSTKQQSTVNRRKKPTANEKSATKIDIKATSKYTKKENDDIEDDDCSSNLSYSSRSTIQSNNKNIHRSKSPNMILNDSGFSTLSDDDSKMQYI